MNEFVNAGTHDSLLVDLVATTKKTLDRPPLYFTLLRDLQIKTRPISYTGRTA